MFDTLITTYRRATRDVRLKKCQQQLAEIAQKRVRLKNKAIAVQKRYEEILKEF